MRRLTIALGLMTGIAVGLGAGGCLYGSCPEPDAPIELVDAPYTGTLRAATDIGAHRVPADGELSVDVDLESARVVLRFVDDEGREVVHRYDIVSTEQGWL